VSLCASRRRRPFPIRRSTTNTRFEGPLKTHFAAKDVLSNSALFSRLYNDVGNLLDDKFKTAQNLTYYTMGGRTDVDTSRFRRAIWNYIQCLLGIRHDDYDYGEINHLLERSLKTFIKSAVVIRNASQKRTTTGFSGSSSTAKR
jgi:hypothetical protein